MHHQGGFCELLPCLGSPSPFFQGHSGGQLPLTLLTCCSTHPLMSVSQWRSIDPCVRIIAWRAPERLCVFILFPH